MARPTIDPDADGADEARPESRLLNSTQQDVVGEASDGDGGERPVREKLKKTSIASLAQYTNSRTNPALQPDEVPPTTKSRAEQADLSHDATSTVRGRPARKRSFDDLQNEDTQNTVAANELGGIAEKGSHHKRMRSRDITGSDGLVSNGQSRTDHLEYHDEEESDVDARRSPGGPGVLVEPPAVTETTPPPIEPTANETILSPKKKRSRDQFDKDQGPKDEGSDDSGDSIIRSGSEPAENDDQLAQVTSRTATGEPEKKRPRDDELKREVDQTAREFQTTSAFANTAIASPFAAFSRSKSPLTADAASKDRSGQATDNPKTSTSAFASSGLSAFSGSEKSPFSVLGSNSASAAGGFGSLASPEHSTGGFGSAGGFGGTSPFATQISTGFGGLGSSGFGGLRGSSTGSTLAGGFGGSRPLGGGGLSSFAARSGGAASFGGGSAAKRFGAPTDEDEGDSEDEDGDESDDEAATDKPKDRRFHGHDLETGEEAEESVFSCRAKLYHFEDKVWKERGAGIFKINTAWAPSSEESIERKSRLIMRTDGVHKVVLNTPVFKGMKVGTPEGGEPNGKTLNVTGMEGGKPTLFALKIGKEEVVKDLYHKIMHLQESL